MPSLFRLAPWCTLAAIGSSLVVPAFSDETVSTAVYSRIGNGYERKRQAGGSFAPEYYGLANGGRLEGTTSDKTMDRLSYAEIATLAMRFLGEQNYHYAARREQATLMLVLHWGKTTPEDTTNSNHAVNALTQRISNLTRSSSNRAQVGPSSSGSLPSMESGNKVPIEAIDAELSQVLMENRVRDARNLPNARLLGYLDDINDADGIQRWAGGGDRYRDLIADIEESRYYIVISAYDFDSVVNPNREKKLLWQSRVSVRAPGNRFDHTLAPMLKSASRHFGQDSGKLIRRFENTATVEMGDLQFKGEANQALAPASDSASAASEKP